MKRFLLQLILILQISIPGYALADAPTAFVEGKEYQRAPEAVLENDLVKDFMKESNGKIQVLEFFSYACHWCYKLDPLIASWHKTAPANISFERVPVEFQAAWAPLTKSYYVNINLGQEKLHQALFDAIHHQQINNTSEETLKQFYVTQGVKAEDFTKAFDSFDTTRKQKWANAISRAYRITAIPAVVVQGPKGVYVTTVRMAGTQENLISVVDFLIKLQEPPANDAPKVNSKQ